METLSTGSPTWAPFALALFALMACSTPEPHAAPEAPAEAPAPAALVAPVPVVDSEAPSLPVGEEPPPAGTHFVDVARATTTRRGTYSEMEFDVPSVAWPPIAYRHGLGMRVRWSVFHSCADGVPGPVQLRDGVVTFSWAGGRPMRCGESLSEFETTLPPGNDAAYALRGPSGPVQPLPDVLSLEAPRRALPRSRVLDPWAN